MDVVRVRGLFDGQLRRGAVVDGGSGRLERAEGVVRQVGGAAHEWTGVLWSELDEASADAAIAAQVSWLASPEGADREFEWKLYAHDRPADLGDRLLAAGFTPEPPETLMVAETGTLPVDCPLPDGVRLAPVTDAYGVQLLADAHEAAFGTSADRLRARLLDQVARGDDTLS
ncbi:MAG TPA: GNAT family N-acetyltransferase, partial [Streptomyces sp.]